MVVYTNTGVQPTQEIKACHHPPDFPSATPMALKVTKLCVLCPCIALSALYLHMSGSAKYALASWESFMLPDLVLRWRSVSEIHHSSFNHCPVDRYFGWLLVFCLLAYYYEIIVIIWVLLKSGIIQHSRNDKFPHLSLMWTYKPFLHRLTSRITLDISRCL